MTKPMYSIIIPAKNEEKRIVKTLNDYISFFRKEGNFEIYVVMNSCTDNTLDVVRRFARKHPEVKYKYFDSALGKGGAIKKGIGLVKGNLVAYVDADGATAPKEILDLAGKIGKYDGVMGSRWVKGAKIAKRQPLGRLIASRGFNLLVRLILGLHYKDTQCAAKIFKSKTIKTVVDDVREKNFAFDACLLYLMKKRGYVIKEVPIEWKDVEESSVEMRSAIPRMLIAVIRTRLRGAR